MKNPTARKIRAAHGTSLAILLAIGWMAYLSVQQVVQTTEWVERTQTVLDTLSDAVTAITDAESAQRGFLITGDDSYLDPYSAALPRIQRDLLALRRLAPGDTAQRRRLDVLQRLAARKLAFIARSVQVRRENGLDSAIQVTRGDEGRRRMDQIREAAGGIETEHRALLQARREEASANFRRAVLIAAIGFIAALAITAVATLRIEREMLERLRAERRAQNARHVAEAASRAKSDFLARISHELRTPLNSVIGFSNVLLKNRSGSLRDQEITYLDRIRDNGLHLLRLIDDLLDLAKIEAGKQQLAIVSTSLGELIEGTLRQLEGRAIGKPVALQTEIPEHLAPLDTDPVMLKRVLINLVGNALKFTDAGSVTVCVKAAPDTHRPVQIDVTDSGIGIPVDRQRAIFEPFEQVDANAQEGTGLGLAISRSLCELMGYRLTVTSEPGKGSRFSVHLAAGGERRTRAAPPEAPAAVYAEAYDLRA